MNLWLLKSVWLSSKGTDSGLYLALNDVVQEISQDNPRVNSKIPSYKVDRFVGYVSCLLICFLLDKLYICSNLVNRIPIVSIVQISHISSCDMCEPL